MNDLEKLLLIKQKGVFLQTLRAPSVQSQRRSPITTLTEKKKIRFVER